MVVPSATDRMLQPPLERSIIEISRAKHHETVKDICYDIDAKDSAMKRGMWEIGDVQAGKGNGGGIKECRTVHRYKHIERSYIAKDCNVLFLP